MQKEKKKFAWSLWIPVILAFLIVSVAWFTLIKIAHQNPVQVIEIETQQSDK
jgi:large-conductance mechanosensitive channel